MAERERNNFKTSALLSQYRASPMKIVFGVLTGSSGIFLLIEDMYKKNYP